MSRVTAFDNEGLGLSCERTQKKKKDRKFHSVGFLIWVCLKGWGCGVELAKKMVNNKKREIISPSLLYHHHHHSLSFHSSIFSLFPNSSSNPNSLFNIRLLFSYFPSLIGCFFRFFSFSLVLSPVFSSGCLSFPLWVRGVVRFGGVFALSSPGNGLYPFGVCWVFVFLGFGFWVC